MIVFISGMPRSGSTFTFNIVRRLLEPRGRLHQVPVESVLSAVKGAGPADHLIFKGHAADAFTVKLIELGAIKVVCSVRKPEDAIASWMDTFGFSVDDSIAAMDRWLHMFRQVRDQALVVRYRAIDTDPFGAARTIAKHVCADSTPEEADTICSGFTKERVQDLSERIANREGAIEDVGFSYYDKATFFHRRHVTSLHERTARSRIAGNDIARIRQLFGSFCDAEGYPV